METLVVGAMINPQRSHYDPTFGMHAGLEQKARMVQELSNGNHFPDAHPAARALRKKIDEENKNIISNKLKFTSDMKAKRRAEVAEVMKQISSDVKKRKAEALKMRKEHEEEKHHHFKANVPKQNIDPADSETVRQRINKEARQGYSDQKIEEIRQKMKDDLAKKRRARQQQDSNDRYYSEL